MSRYLAGVFGALVAGGLIRYFGTGSPFKLVYIFGIIGSSVICYELVDRFKKDKN
jgi:uncharacterized membrane protein YeaQ/YmgE (transglycosylase-associated protein family)